MFKIEKSKPMPNRLITYEVFPLDNMEIGDSFFCHKEKFNKNTCCATKNFIKNRIKKYIKDKESKKQFFITQERDQQGVRVFRVK